MATYSLPSTTTHPKHRQPILATGTTPSLHYTYRRDISSSPPAASDTVSSTSTRSGNSSPPGSSSNSSRPESRSSSTSIKDSPTPSHAHAHAQIDVRRYVDERVANTYTGVELGLDRALAGQAKDSGTLNAKSRQLSELQARATARLNSTRASLAEGVRVAREVQAELEWTQARVAKLNDRAAAKYPAQYRAASARHPRVVDVTHDAFTIYEFYSRMLHEL